MLTAVERDFIEGQRVAHLATADGSARPHVVPVCFAYLEGRFYIAIDEKPKQTLRLKRLRNIDENPQVALIFDRYHDDWSRLAWVLVHGTASTISGGPEHERAVHALRKRYKQYQRMALEERPIIRVAVENVRNWGDLG